MWEYHFNHKYIKDKIHISDVERLLKENQRQMEEINLFWEQRLQEARREWQRANKGSQGDDQGEWKNSPHIMNVNEDTQLSGIIKHCFKAGKYLDINQSINLDILY
jgi:hypothetical protein